MLRNTGAGEESPSHSSLHVPFQLPSGSAPPSTNPEAIGLRYELQDQAERGGIPAIVISGPGSRKSATQTPCAARSRPRRLRPPRNGLLSGDHELSSRRVAAGTAYAGMPGLQRCYRAHHPCPQEQHG
ncbi:hypothetical protein HPB48_022853 [Haemaphysalis longicornis]|uniref:Uncharacterized protein n=1 Tax=Haemaphysalis longicornis TaxID=44386 RepID=A0A9J6GB80_HAELO|nr:hypothetical protein HPB48_022853 [Haemaphysalis longicornis]